MDSFRFYSWLCMLLIPLVPILGWSRLRRKSRSAAIFSSIADLKGLPVTLMQRIRRLMPLVYGLGLCLIITGLAGLRPRPDDTIEVNPLLPEKAWDYFCLDRVPYHGRLLTIVWDKTGRRYGKGEGLQVLADGRPIARSQGLAPVTGELPGPSSE